MQRRYQDWSEGGLLVQDAHALCNLSARWSVCYMKRSGNVAVHELAKDATKLESDLIDLLSIPHCVIAAMQQDNVL